MATPYLLYFLSIFSLSQAAAIMRWAAIPPDVIGFWRLLGGSLVMGAVLFVTTKNISLLKWKKEHLPHFFVCALFFSTHLWTYAFSAQQTTVANCLVLFSTNPLWVALGNWLFYKQKLKVHHAASFCFAFAGITLVMNPNSFGLLTFTEPQHQTGNWVALLSGFLYAGYLLSSKKLRQKNDNAVFTHQMYLIASLLFLVFALLQNRQIIPEKSQTWIALAAALFIPTLMGHALFTWLIQKLDLNLMACGKLTEPLLAALTAFLFFAELPKSNTWLGFMLTTIALLTLFVPELLTRPKVNRHK